MSSTSHALLRGLSICWTGTGTPLIETAFLSSQVYHDSEEGQRYIQFYKLNKFPYISILDPRTGEQRSHLLSLLFATVLTVFSLSKCVQVRKWWNGTSWMWRRFWNKRRASWLSTASWTAPPATRPPPNGRALWVSPRLPSLILAVRCRCVEPPTIIKPFIETLVPFRADVQMNTIGNSCVSFRGVSPPVVGVLTPFVPCAAVGKLD